MENHKITKNENFCLTITCLYDRMLTNENEEWLF